MKINSIVTASAAILISCSVGSQNTQYGTYGSSDGTILTFDEYRAYFGPNQTPSTANILEGYGTPIKYVSDVGVKCVIISDITFAYSRRSNFECNGFNFEVIGKSRSVVRIHAQCGVLRNGICTTTQKGPPALEYEFEFRVGHGVQWVRFGRADESGGVLEHQSGAYILGD